MFIVTISLFLLIFGTIQAYRKFGLKRVLLGKKNDNRELIYRTKNNEINWKQTLKSWKIILTGGMDLLTIFLVIILLILSFAYSNDIKTIKNNDYKLCNIFGTTNPTTTQLTNYNNLNISNIINGKNNRGKNSRSNTIYKK